ncbi:thermonuclease family protein [Pelagibius sp.]|uniref:thermonuclease family protein n=1 Tax=Pelagibius sp. TaxID=1931238 RepID=UPI002632F894|nr:thermonuclease family protein [Pelagibius sp.]
MIDSPPASRQLLLCAALALAAAFAIIVAAPVPADAQVEGRRPQVIDTATLDFAGRQVRLFGLQGIPGAQTCTVGTLVWACGQEALWAARNRIANHWVHCRPATDVAADADAAVICDLGGPGGPELNAWLVEQGWARAAPANVNRTGTAPYAEQEDAARAAGQGIWRGP